ncbi:MAG: pirin family protein [Myxococcota bacterium]
MPRIPTRVVPSQPTSDGAGVKLSRAIGTPALGLVDPFLMLDEFRSDQAGDYIAGFPNHPHRGFETVTYMLAGAMEHQDSVGNKGRLGPGSVQWMTAGRGIIHSEMPRQESGLMWGFQLWVNLPAARKMDAPRYQDIPPEDVPVHEPAPGVRVKVVTGTFDGVEGPVKGIATAPLFLDVTLPPGAVHTFPVPVGHAVFAYVFEGTVGFGASGNVSGPVARGNTVLFSDGDAVVAEGGTHGGRFILLAGKPLREPIARYGPFVMNTEAEIHQAFADYRAGRLGR